MSRLCRLLFIIIIACTGVSCSHPVGNIGGSSQGGQDALLAVPYRVAYEVNDLFLRHEDLSVFTSVHGTVLPIPVDNISLAIVEDPDFSGEQIPIPAGENYPLTDKGRKVIVVEYLNMSARYSIEVKDPYDLSGSSGSSGSNGAGIIIEWVAPW